MAKRILVMGLPGSGKSTLANKLKQRLGTIAEHFNADDIRRKYDDWDFSEEGRLRQANRMRELADASNAVYAIMDFVCPKQEYRDVVEADVVIWMDTIKEGRYEDTNKAFEAPSLEDVDYRFTEYESHEQCDLIYSQLQTFDWRKETVQMLGRWQPWHDGHFALFERAVAKTGQVCIQIRDCQGWNGSNPFAIDEVKLNIIRGLEEKGFTYGKEYVIMMVPNITNITYGRDVGYKIEQEVFTDEIHSISATKIRKAMGYNT